MLSSHYTPLPRKVSHTYSTLQSKRAYDPTHTSTLRAAFERAMSTKFAKLRGEIRKAIVVEDCFGLRPLKTNATMGNRAFDFGTSADKVEAFMEWLHKESSAIILDLTNTDVVKVGSGINKAWTNTYIDSSYQKGIARARTELLAAGYPVPSVEESGGIHVLFNQPIHTDRVGILYTRVFTQLKGITDQMGTQISQVLSQAMMDGKGPAEMARLLTRTITGPMGDLGITDTLGRFIPAQRRAMTLARTEVIRAHHLATVQEYRNFGVAGVNVKAELRTAGDDRVCDKCKSLEAQTFTLDAVEKLIPVHPGCRCCAIPKPYDDKKGATK